MHLELDPSLVEEVVFRAMRGREQRGDEAVFGEYRRHLDAAYALPEGDRSRDLAFRNVYAMYFEKLGFQQTIRGYLAEFPWLGRQLDRVAFLKAFSRREETSELFVRPSEAEDGKFHRTAVVRLLAESLLHADGLARLLRRELYHISDMVDPAFGYQPRLPLSEAAPARENLLRDRYRTVWSVFTEARLIREGRGTEVDLKQEQSLLKRAFAGLGDQESETICHTASMASSLTHADLVALANR